MAVWLVVDGSVNFAAEYNPWSIPEVVNFAHMARMASVGERALGLLPTSWHAALTAIAGQKGSFFTSRVGMRSTKTLVNLLRALPGHTTVETASLAAEAADRLAMLYQACGGISVEQNALARLMYANSVVATPGALAHAVTFNELPFTQRRTWLNRAFEELQ